MKDQWVKNVCPFCKDQGFDSVIGDPVPGETVISFTHTLAGTSDVLVIATETATSGSLTALGTDSGIGTQGQRIIHQMADANYRVFISQAASGAGAAETGAYVDTKTVTGFTLYGVDGATYDVVVVGRVLF